MSNKNPFKDSLNLPQTDFAMRANLQENEAKTLKNWESINLYERMLEAREGEETFILHDGPPYANGAIHIGHLLNKVLKDFVIRSQHLFGKRCPFVPGWDCHGLPIEHRVVQDITEKKPDLLDSLKKDKKSQVIRSACAKYADQHIKLQKAQMKQLLTVGDYEDPYLTKNTPYEGAVLDVFAKLIDEGLVYRQLKPVHWSIANQTALAEAELEYKMRVDPSVYVAFDLLDSKAFLERLKITQDKAISALIWTTTPWTLPANLAIAIHQELSYSIVESKSKWMIVASDRLEFLENTSGHKIDKIIATFSGDKLLNIGYQHPFILDRQGKIVHADYVSLDTGTGLVHTAPGHGLDDYITGQRIGLDSYCPVKADGCFDTSAPNFLAGKLIWDANPLIIETLTNSGHLYYSHDYEHSYPHDWRSKTPVIFRATEQWFIGVDIPLKTTNKSLRTLALEHIESEIDFIPAWGQNRLRGMLEARPDWCISRQRAWGLPIPAFKLPDGNTLLTAKSTQAVSKYIAEHGSDHWFSESPATLLSYYNKEDDANAPKNLDIHALEKMNDIFDVWFESGSSWSAVSERRFGQAISDVYLEGSDQHRGWFHLSLLPALGIIKKSPFKTLITHGFMVDKDGFKMSKSGGNALTVEALLKKYGADVLRWWVASLNTENDIKVDESFFDSAADSYRKLRNTLRFLLSNLDGKRSIANFQSALEACKAIPKESIDYYILQKLAECLADYKKHCNAFRFKHSFTALQHFIIEPLSAIYCSTVKDRLYCDSKNSERRKQSQLVMWVICDLLARAVAPFIPHTAQEIFSSLYEEEPNIHLETLPEFSLKTDTNWEAVLQARDRALQLLEQHPDISAPLDAGVILPKDSFDADYLADFADLCGFSQAHFDESATDISLLDLRDTPACARSWKRDGTVKGRDNGHLLSDRDYEAMLASVSAS